MDLEIFNSLIVKCEWTTHKYRNMTNLPKTCSTVVAFDSILNEVLTTCLLKLIGILIMNASIIVRAAILYADTFAKNVSFGQKIWMRVYKMNISLIPDYKKWI